jgi:catechol 2,3-dioxygenase-like lactoylglutathione lyase family enzyme
MLDHVSLGVSDLARSQRFYDAALRPLGLVRITITVEEAPQPSLGMHLCFRARDREAVKEFHRLALAHGGRDDGAPGPRPQYHASYFGAFVLDPDGHRIEAVCHAPVMAENI